MVVRHIQGVGKMIMVARFKSLAGPYTFDPIRYLSRAVPTCKELPGEAVNNIGNVKECELWLSWVKESWPSVMQFAIIHLLACL